MLIKASFMKNDKPSGRTYTYRTEDDVKPGDIVTDAKGGKLVVVDEPVDMEWVKSYGEEKIAVVEKCVEPKEKEHFDYIRVHDAQRKYCNEKGYPHFAPNYRCYRCEQNIYAEEGRLRNGEIGKGISVERAGRELITGCPFCNWSYCE